MTAEAIETFFDRYVDAFSTFDVDAIVRLWCFPATITTGSGTHVFDESAFRKNTRALCDFYRRQGMARARKRVTGVFPMAVDVASVTTEDVLQDADGQPIASWQHGYVLRETEGRIRAMAAIADSEVAAWAKRGTPLGS